MVAALKIEKRLPVPVTPKTAGVTATLRKMGVGESFTLPEGIKPYSTHSNARSLGMKIIIRKQPNGSFQVWRTK